MTGTGLILGSAAYLAPEVAKGAAVGPGSDTWSLGGLRFACVEGRPPFDRGTLIATLTSVVKDLLGVADAGDVLPVPRVRAGSGTEPGRRPRVGAGRHPTAR